MEKQTEQSSQNLQATVNQLRNNCEYNKLAELLQLIGIQQNDVAALRQAVVFFLFAKRFDRAEILAEALSRQTATKSNEVTALYAYSLLLQAKSLEAQSVLQTLTPSKWQNACLGADDEDFLLCLDRTPACQVQIIDAGYIEKKGAGTIDVVCSCPHCQTPGKVRLQTTLELTFVPCTSCFGPAVLNPKELRQRLGTLSIRDTRVQTLVARVK